MQRARPPAVRRASGAGAASQDQLVLGGVLMAAEGAGEAMVWETEE